MLLLKALSKQHGNPVVSATLKRRQWLCKQGQKNILLRLEIENGKTNGSSYEPGDHAVVFPVNKDEDVDFILERLTKLPPSPKSIVQLYEYNQMEGNLLSVIIFDFIFNAYVI